MAKKKRPDREAHGLPPSEPPPKPTLFGWLRSRFFAGVVIAAPIAISIGVVYWFILFMDARIKPLLPPILKPETYTNIAIPGFGVLVAIIALTLLGAIATNLIGRSILRISDRMLSSIPVVSNLYSAFKQLFELIASNEQATFKEVVLVEYPKKGTWCIGFLTARARGEVRSRLGEEFIGVFVPTTPNPTSGFLMYVSGDEIIHLDMTVEEGAKLIISAGLVVPEDLPREEPEDASPQPGAAGPGGEPIRISGPAGRADETAPERG